MSCTWRETDPVFPHPDKSVMALLQSMSQHQLMGIQEAIGEICDERNQRARILLGCIPGIAAENTFSHWLGGSRNCEHGFGEGTTAYDRALHGNQEAYQTLLAEKNAVYQAAGRKPVS